MMAPLVEQIARALCKSGGDYDPDQLNGAVGVAWRLYEDDARAALPVVLAAVTDLIQAEAQAQDLTVARANENHEATAAVIHETVARRCREIIARIRKLGE